MEKGLIDIGILLEPIDVEKVAAAQSCGKKIHRVVERAPALGGVAPAKQSTATSGASEVDEPRETVKCETPDGSERNEQRE